MSLNLVNTTAARVALFIAGARRAVVGETEKPRTLYVLNPVDREILAYETLGIIAEANDGYVSEDDIVEAAWHWATSPDEIPAMATDLYRALTRE